MLTPGEWHVIARRPTMPPPGRRILWEPTEDAPMTLEQAWHGTYARSVILMHRRTHDGWTEAVVALWPQRQRARTA